MRRIPFLTVLIFFALAGVAGAADNGPGTFDPGTNPVLAHQQKLAEAQTYLAEAQAGYANARVPLDVLNSSHEVDDLHSNYLNNMAVLKQLLANPMIITVPRLDNAITLIDDDSFYWPSMGFPSIIASDTMNSLAPSAAYTSLLNAINAQEQNVTQAWLQWTNATQAQEEQTAKAVAAVDAAQAKVQAAQAAVAAAQAAVDADNAQGNSQ